jgi:hypothetical protein
MFFPGEESLLRCSAASKQKPSVAGMEAAKSCSAQIENRQLRVATDPIALYPTDASAITLSPNIYSI